MRSVFRRGLGLIIFIFLLPLMALIALALRVMQGSPVLFHQTRAGLGGRNFKIVKFRSMRDTRDASGELLPDEMRVTRIGNLLRRTRLDELPGIWNVVNGDLAFVGPRPLLPWTIADMEELGVVRCSVLPGITGWSQVNGNILLTNDEKVALDIWYIKNRSLALDLKIIMLTLVVMVTGEKMEGRTAPPPPSAPRTSAAKKAHDASA